MLNQTRNYLRDMKPLFYEHQLENLSNLSSIRNKVQNICEQFDLHIEQKDDYLYCIEAFYQIAYLVNESHAYIYGAYQKCTRRNFKKHFQPTGDYFTDQLRRFDDYVVSDNQGIDTSAGTKISDIADQLHNLCLFTHVGHPVGCYSSDSIQAAHFMLNHIYTTILSNLFQLGVIPEFYVEIPDSSVEFPQIHFEYEQIQTTQIVKPTHIISASTLYLKNGTLSSNMSLDELSSTPASASLSLNTTPTVSAFTLYLTQTQTRLTCVTSQKSFMSLVWYTAKAMNKNAKGSKAYLKPATAFVQKWLQQNTSGIYIFLRPQQQMASAIEVNPTAQYQRNVDSGFIIHTTPTTPLAKLAGAPFITALVNFGFFQHATGFT